LLCAVLRERWGKGVSVVCAWLLPEAFVQRSNIAHNVSSVYGVKNGHTAKFAMKHGFFVFKAEGRENILK